MLVLEGDQGAGKSSALAILAADPAWFSDSCPFNAEGREVIEALSGKWIVEAGELAGLRKASSEKLKSFLSRTVDQGRAAYGRIPQSVRRQCIFIGTTNSAAYLNDGTGNRRFLPVRIERFDLECLKRDRDQLWAEAAVRERDGESIRLPESLWAYAAAEQDNRRVEDPIVAALETAFGASTGRIRASCVWELLDIPMAQRASMAAAVGKAMQELGWERRKLRFGGPNPEWGYQRGTASECQTRLTSGLRGLVVRDNLSIIEEAA
jgi:predicted P-loop ATPase